MKTNTLAAVTCAIVASLTILVSVAHAAPPRCDLVSTQNWTIPAMQGSPATTLRVIGRSTGRSCARAALSYTILNARGRVLFRQTHQSQFVAPFAQVRTRSQMRAALTDWIKPVNRANFKAGLPDWLAGADAPEAREFGFTPAETMTREEYLGIKADATPLRCYVQGMESINCVIFHGGVIDPFGIQAFPG
jgi:hypothetical protein